MSEDFNLTPKQQTALAEARRCADIAFRETGFWPTLLVAEWVLASKWGTDQPGNNPFRVKYAPHVHRWGWQSLASHEFVLAGQLEDFRREHPEAKVISDRLNGAILEVSATVAFAAYPSLVEAFIERARLYQFVAPYCHVWQILKDEESPVEFLRVISGADERGARQAAKLERIIEGIGEGK